MSTPSQSRHFEAATLEDVQEIAGFLNDLITAGKRPSVTVEYGKKTRTLTQNASLHLFLAQLAETLNDAGLDMRVVLKPEVDIPWTKDTAKEFLWRPIQKALLGEESTRKASTVDYTPVYEVLARHLGSKHGVRIPEWPCIDSQMRQSSV